MLGKNYSFLTPALLYKNCFYVIILLCQEFYVIFRYFLGIFTLALPLGLSALRSFFSFGSLLGIALAQFHRVIK